MSETILKLITSSPEETEAAGARLAEILKGDSSLPRFVAMYGDLGSGKTAFTRGFASLASPSSAVRSPTFTIVNEYSGATPLFHFDMYRLEDEEALFDIGWEDYLERGGVCAVEWSENVEEAMEDAIYITIEKLGEDARRITIEGGEKIADLSL